MKPETILPLDQIEYPDSDGKPMAENTRQFRIIVTIQGNLDALFADQPDVFVAGDLLWYAQRGVPAERLAPDAMVVFGRPKGDRGSYKQWEEDGIAPQVVWEVLSPGNTSTEMADKRAFYERHGVVEYYEYDPDRGLLRGWMRQGHTLEPVGKMQGHVSRLLGVSMELDEFDELILTRPNGARFLSFLELDAGYRETREELRRERLAREEAERVAAGDLRRERLAREQTERKAAEELQRVRLAREQTERKAAEELRRERLAKEEAERRAETFAARLRALGLDPDKE